MDPVRELSRSDNESELIAAAQQGCHKAFTTLVTQHQDRIFQVCFRLLQCREEAQETCQEVFLSAFKALPRFRPEAKFSTWLYQIALNRCRDHWKKSSRKISSNSQPLDHSIPSSQINLDHPDEVAEWSDELSKLKKNLDKLSPAHREIIILSCIEQLSHAECAVILKCSSRAVEGRLRRARKELLKLWEKTE